MKNKKKVMMILTDTGLALPLLVFRAPASEGCLGSSPDASDTRARLGTLESINPAV